MSTECNTIVFEGLMISFRLTTYLCMKTKAI